MRIELNEFNVLINLTHFNSLGLYTAIGINYTIDAEVAIGRSSGIAVVTTIIPVFASVAGLGGKALIYPVPDATTLQYRIFLNHIPIILEVAKTVTHSMSIFTQDKRTSHFLILGILFNRLGRRVHRTINIRIPF